MTVLLEKESVSGGENTDGNSNPKGDVDPSPHFSQFLLDGVVFLRLEEFLLVLHPRPNLLDRFGLHFGFGAETRNRLGVAAL